MKRVPQNCQVRLKSLALKNKDQQDLFNQILQCKPVGLKGIVKYKEADYSYIHFDTHINASTFYNTNKGHHLLLFGIPEIEVLPAKENGRYIVYSQPSLDFQLQAESSTTSNCVVPPSPPQIQPPSSSIAITVPPQVPPPLSPITTTTTTTTTTQVQPPSSPIETTAPSQAPPPSSPIATASQVHPPSSPIPTTSPSATSWKRPFEEGLKLLEDEKKDKIEKRRRLDLEIVAVEEKIEMTKKILDYTR